MSMQRLKEIVPCPRGISKLEAVFTVASKAPWVRELRNLRVPMPPKGTLIPDAMKRGQCSQRNANEWSHLFQPGDEGKITPGIMFLLMAKQNKVDVTPDDGTSSFFIFDLCASF